MLFLLQCIYTVFNLTSLPFLGVHYLCKSWLTALQVQHALLFIHGILGQVHVTRHRWSDPRNQAAQLIMTQRASSVASKQRGLKPHFHTVPPIYPVTTRCSPSFSTHKTDICQGKMAKCLANSCLFTHPETQGNIGIHLESCFWPPVKYNSNIHSAFLSLTFTGSCEKYLPL